MMDNVEDFLSVQPVIANIALATLGWAVALPLLKLLFRAVTSVCFSRPIPASRAYIPRRLPHPNPPGSAVLFELRLTKATDEQIQQFMKFRGCCAGGWDRARDGLDAVAMQAAAYKGELYEERTMSWIDEHFRQKLPNLRYPYVAAHWNGWSSFWVETGPHIQSMFLASLVLTVEHVLNGLFLPYLYLRTGRVVYFDLAMYGEIGFQVVACSCIAASYLSGRDRTVEQMHRAVWPLLLAHHFSSIGLCILSLELGDDCPREQACYLLFALLGCTSTLHYVGQMLDFSPFSHANAPYVRLVNHAICLGSQIYFRGVYWVKIAYCGVHSTLEVRGPQTAAGVFLVMLLFTAFNMDFIKFHLKATIGCWKKMQEKKLV